MPFVPDTTAAAPTRPRFVPDAAQAAPTQPSVGKQVLQGGGEALLQIGSSSIAAPLSGIAGLVGSALPGPQGQGANWTEGVQNALTYQPRTSAGQSTANVLAYPFEKLQQGSDFAGQKALDITGSPAVATAVNTALQAAPAILTRKTGVKPAGAPRPNVHPAITQAETAGYTLQPSQIVGGKPVGSLGKRIAERGGGKADLPAEASLRNQQVTNRLVAEEIGLKNGESITPAVIEKLRKEANAKYDALQNVKAKIDPDVDYFYGLHQIRDSSRSTVKGGKPDPQINKLINDYQQANKKFTIADSMEEVRRLRFDARKNMGADKPQTVRLGEAQRQIADLMEDMIDRQVSPINPAAVTEWRAARKQLAKLHLVDDALKGTEVDAGVIAKALSRGDPLTGNLKTIGEIASNFPTVTQHGARLGSKAGAGLLDIAMSVPTLGAWALGREASKRIALRRPAPSARVSAAPVAVGGQQATSSPNLLAFP